MEPVVHDVVRLERRLSARPERVFAGFADPALKARWENPSNTWEMPYDNRDFRVDGHEISHCGPPGERLFHFAVRYLEIIANRLIVYSSTSADNEGLNSASLTTIELRPEGEDGTLLVYSEQIAFLDGRGMAKEHAQGMETIFNQLQAVMAEDR